jgi:transcriptional regulator with XRE-family HTH domain
MTEQGRTNVWLAEKIGATEQSVSNWRGGNYPQPRFMKPIANALGVTVGYLFFDEGVDMISYTA